MISADIQRPPSSSSRRQDSQIISSKAKAIPQMARCQPLSVPSRAHTATAAARGSTPTRDNHALALMANTPVKNVSHRPMVHTAISTPSCVPRGGSTEIMYLNEPNVISQPELKVFKVGIT